MAEVLRREFTVETTGEYDATAVWATPEEIAKELTAAGFGPVKEAAAKALDDAADDATSAAPNDPANRAAAEWLRARAAAVRGEG